MASNFIQHVGKDFIRDYSKLSVFLIIENFNLHILSLYRCRLFRVLYIIVFLRQLSSPRPLWTIDHKQIGCFIFHTYNRSRRSPNCEVGFGHGFATPQTSSSLRQRGVLEHNWENPLLSFSSLSEMKKKTQIGLNTNG